MNQRERVPLNMFDTIFHYTADPSKEPNYDAPRADFLAWAATRYVGEPTKRLFTTPEVMSPSGRRTADGMGMLPNDETMIVTDVTLELLNVKDPMTCRNILDHVTLGLMVNTSYEYLERRGQPEIARRLFMVLTEHDPEHRPGAQIAARMGFYVTALIGRKAKETLEATPGAHLLVRLGGEHVREATGPVKQ